MNIIKKLLHYWYTQQFLHLGANTSINPFSSLSRKELISIGHNTFIGKQCHISVERPAKLTIGNYVLISPYVKILAGDHDFSQIGNYLITVNNGQNESIIIEDDVWIGMDAMILKGVTIGGGAIIGAKSLITKSILPYTIAVGVPAKMVKLRFSLENLRRHIDLVESLYNYDVLLEEYKKVGLTT